MADQTLGNGVLPNTGQATQSHIEGAHIKTQEFDPGKLKHAIAVHIITGNAPPSHIDSLGHAPLGITQPQGVAAPTAAIGAQYQAIQTSPVPSLAIHPAPHHTPAEPYRPFASNPAATSIPLSIPYERSPHSPPSAFFGPSNPSIVTSPNISPTQAQPQTPSSHVSPQGPASTQSTAPSAAFNSNSTAQVVPPQPATTSSSATAATPSMTQAPSNQQTHGTSSLVAPSHNNGIHNDSIAAHIQNVLATMPSSSSQPNPTVISNLTTQLSPAQLNSPPSPERTAAIHHSPSSVHTQPAPATAQHQQLVVQPSELSVSPSGPRETPLPRDAATNRNSTPDTAPNQSSDNSQAPGLTQPPTQPLSYPPPTTNTPTPSELRLNPAPQTIQTEHVPQVAPSPKEEAPTALPLTIRPLIEVTIQPLPDQTKQHETLHHEYRHHQRMEQLRDIQQITAAEHEPTRPVADRTTSRDASSPSSEKREQTTQTIERLRESLLDKLLNLQGQIDTTAAQRQRLDDLRDPSDRRIQGRDVLARPDPIHHDAKPSLITRLADRLHDKPLPTAGIRDSLVGLTSAAMGDRARLRHIDSTSPFVGSPTSRTAQPISHPRRDAERCSNLIDLLKRFSQRSVNFQLLTNMDTSLERACLTVVTGAALGVVGLELLYRATTLVAIQTLGLLRKEEREEDSAESDPQQSALERGLTHDLEKCTTTELSTVDEEGFVVDLAGVVVSVRSGRPLAHVTVSCAEFGTCITDSDGRFIFQNIPLGTPYTITVSSSAHVLTPLVVTGTCGELAFLRIAV